MLAPLLAALLLAPASSQEFVIDASTGSIIAVLESEGALKALAHDHVVDAREFEGELTVAGEASNGQVRVGAEWIEIDAPATREAAKVEGKLSEKDREKIREQMRGPKGLSVKDHPKIVFRALKAYQVEGESIWMVDGEFELRGVKQAVQIPVEFERSARGTWFHGRLRIKPSDYGIKPFKVLGGMIRVKDEALIRFRLLARPR